MNDILNLQMNWESYRTYVDRCMSDGARDPEMDLIAHMSFVAGAQAVMSCLGTDRTDGRFDRMIDEVQMMRGAVVKRIVARNAGEASASTTPN